MRTYLNFFFEIFCVNGEYLSYIIQDDTIFISPTKDEYIAKYVPKCNVIVQRFTKFTDDTFIMSVFNILLAYHQIKLNTQNIFNIYNIFICHLELYVDEKELLVIKNGSNIKMKTDYFENIKITSE